MRGGRTGLLAFLRATTGQEAADFRDKNPWAALIRPCYHGRQGPLRSPPRPRIGAGDNCLAVNAGREIGQNRR